MPILRLLPQALETNPARVGPPEQPRSPARASKANMAVPPRGIMEEALLKVPGHRIPTEKPHSHIMRYINLLTKINKKTHSTHGRIRVFELYRRESAA